MGAILNNHRWAMLKLLEIKKISVSSTVLQESSVFPVTAVWRVSLLVSEAVGEGRIQTPTSQELFV